MVSGGRKTTPGHRNVNSFCLFVQHNVIVNERRGRISDDIGVCDRNDSRYCKEITMQMCQTLILRFVSTVLVTWLMLHPAIAASMQRRDDAATPPAPTGWMYYYDEPYNDYYDDYNSYLTSDKTAATRATTTSTTDYTYYYTHRGRTTRK